jgi:single-strand DNA-binding protein
MSVNRVTLLGHVGQIEIKSFDGQNGPRKCATFSLATTERYKDRSGNIVNNTEWHNIVSWNHAELCEKYVQKGTQLYVEGKLRTRSWEDKSGNKRYVTEIMADSLQILGRKENSQGEQPQQQAPVQQRPQQHQTTAMPYPTETVDDDLPFNWT